MSVIGDNLLKARRDAGLSQEELGQAIGHAGGSYISAIERGRKHPEPELLDKIATALGTTPDLLRQRVLPVR